MTTRTPRKSTVLGASQIGRAATTKLDSNDSISLQPRFTMKDLAMQSTRKTAKIIRQITLNFVKFSFLLVRIRDDIKMTIQAYQMLYESSVAYSRLKDGNHIIKMRAH